MQVFLVNGLKITTLRKKSMDIHPTTMELQFVPYENEKASSGGPKTMIFHKQ